MSAPRRHGWLVAACVAWSGVAHADGALADSTGLLVAESQSGRITLATNFGLFLSDDDGASWRWICEEAVGPLGQLYQPGAPPDGLYAVTATGLVSSADRGCSWTQSALPGQVVLDAFADPAERSRLYVIAQPRSDMGSMPMRLYRSSDGGRSFEGPLYTAPAGTALSGVESAASQPATIYLTQFSDTRAWLLRSSDGGATWQEKEAMALGGSPRLLAVDPIDPLTLYLRVTAAGVDRLAVSHDGGDSFPTRVELGSVMTAFLRRADGRVLVGTRAGSWISVDGGRSFAPWPLSVHPRAFAERGDRLYVATAAADGFAVAVSDDDGASFRPLLGFDLLCDASFAPAACVGAQCAGPLRTQRERLCRGADLGTAPPSGEGCDASGGSGGVFIVSLLCIAAYVTILKRR